MLNQRRKLLQYFRRKNFEAYSVLIVRLGLKDNFVKQVSIFIALGWQYQPVPSQSSYCCFACTGSLHGATSGESGVQDEEE